MEYYKIDYFGYRDMLPFFVERMRFTSSNEAIEYLKNNGYKGEYRISRTVKIDESCEMEETIGIITL